MILELIAAFSSGVGIEMLKCASGMTESKLTSRLNKLEDLYLIKSSTRGSGKSSYQINSELYDFLYTIMDSTHREIAHGKVGLCIEEKFKDNIKEKIFDLFFHFTIAKDFERIAKYGIRAAELSEEATGFFRQKNCKVKLLPTPEAIQEWNMANGKWTGLFHITC